MLTGDHAQMAAGNDMKAFVPAGHRIDQHLGGTGRSDKILVSGKRDDRAGDPADIDLLSFEY